MEASSGVPLVWRVCSIVVGGPCLPLTNQTVAHLAIGDGHLAHSHLLAHVNVPPLGIGGVARMRATPVTPHRGLVPIHCQGDHRMIPYPSVQYALVARHLGPFQRRAYVTCR